MRKAKQLILLLCIAVLSCTVAACGGKKATTVSLSASELSLQAGSTAALTVSVSDGSTATWSSSDPSVAYYQDGAVHGISAGTAVLTASVGSASATCTVTVTSKPAVTPDSIVVTISATSLDLEPEGSATLTAGVRVNGASSANTVVWTSSDPCVTLTPDGNTVTVNAVSNGTAQVKATYGDKSAACTVTVAQIHTVTGTVAVASDTALTGVGLDDATVTLTSGSVTRSAAVDAAGAYTVQVPQGTYTVTASHPSYRNVTTEAEVTDDTTVPDMTFAHYNFGSTLNTSADWTYDEATKTLNAERKRNDNDKSNVSYHFLNGSGSTHYAVTAKISSYAYKWSKVGFVYHGGDTAVEATQYTIMFSPSQNEVNFYQGKTEIYPTVTRYNGASALANRRTSLPAGILVAPEHSPKEYDPLKPNDGDYPLLDNADITVSMVREGEKLYVAVNGVLYLRVDLPDAIKDQPGLIGFCNRDMYQVHVSDIAYDMGETVAAAALAVDVQHTDTNGTVTVENAKLGEEVRLTITPVADYELATLTLDGEPLATTGDPTQTTHAAFMANKTEYTVVATFRQQVQRYAVTGTVAIDSNILIPGTSVQEVTLSFASTDTQQGGVTVNTSGAYSVNLPDGEYTVTATHPRYHAATGTVTVNGGAATVPAITLDKYALGATNGSAVEWAYNASGALEATRVSDDNTGIAYRALAGVSDTHYVYEATINGKGVYSSKFGFIFYAEDMTSQGSIYALAFSPSQNEMHIYKGNSEQNFTRQIFNGMTVAGNTARVKFPGTVLKGTEINELDPGKTNTKLQQMNELPVKIVRDGESLYVFVNNVFYVKYTLPDEIKDKAGAIGFYVRDHYKTAFSNIKYVTGTTAAANAVSVNLDTTVADGTVTDSDNLKLGEEITVTVTPDAGKEVASVTLDGTPLPMRGDTTESVTVSFTATKTSYALVANITNQIARREVTGSVKVHADLNAFDLSQATVTVGTMEPVSVGATGTFTATVPVGTYSITYSHPHYADVVVSNVEIAEGTGAQTLAEATFTHYKLNTALLTNAGTAYSYGSAVNSYVMHASANITSVIPFSFSDPAATDYVMSVTINGTNIPNDTKLGLLVAWDGNKSGIVNAYRLVVSRSQNQMHLMKDFADKGSPYAMFNGATLANANPRFALPAGVIATTSGTTIKELTLKAVRANEVVYIFVNDTLYVKMTVNDLKDQKGYVGFTTQGVFDAVFSNFTYAAGAEAVADALAVTVNTAAAEDGTITVSENPTLGQEVTVTVTPNANKEITGVTLDGQPLTITGNTSESVTASFTPSKKTYEVAASFADYVPRREVSGSVAIHDDLNPYDLAQTSITVGNLPAISGVVAADGTFTATVPTGTYDITYSHPEYADVVVNNVTIAEGDGAQALAGVTFTHYRMDTANYAVNDATKNTVTYEYGTTANTYVTHNSDTSKDPITYMPFGFAKTTDYVFSAKLKTTNMPQYSKIGLIIGWQTRSNTGTAYRIAVDPSQNQVNFYAGGGELTPTYEVFNGASILSSNTKRVNLPAGILVWQNTAMPELTLTVVRLGKDVHVFVNGMQYLTAHIDGLDGKGCYVGLSTQGVNEAEFSNVTYSTDVSAYTGTTAKYTAVSDENATVSIEGTAVDGSIAAGGGNLIRVTATPGAGKIVTGIEVTIGNGLTCGNGFATGAGWLIPVTMSGEYTVKATTVDAATSDLIAYTGTIALDAYYQYDETDNPGMWPDDGYTQNVNGRDNLTVLAGGRFKYDLVHGFGAIDAKEIIAEFTGSSGTYSATLGTPVYDAEGGVYNYPYTVYLPAGAYTYKVRDIDYLSYYLNYNKANAYTLSMINRLQPMTGTVTVSDTNGVTVTLREYDYTLLKSKGSYEQGTTNSDLLCANGTAYTVDTTREEGAVWRTYGTPNFYTDVSEPVFMASWETVAGDTKPWIRFRYRKADGGNDQNIWAAVNEQKVYYNYNDRTVMESAAETVNFHTTGTDLWQIIRQNDHFYIYINGEQAAHYRYADVIASKNMYMPFMLYDLTCKNLKFTFNTAIIDGVMNPAQP